MCLNIEHFMWKILVCKYKIENDCAVVSLTALFVTSKGMHFIYFIFL